MATFGKGIVDAAGNDVRELIRAFHGSPLPEHFDRFDSRYIGTGEGNQTFAFGHYAAQSKGVADDYRRKLSARKLRDDFLEKLPEDASPEDVLDELAYAERNSNSFDPRQQKFLRALDDNEWLGFDYPIQGISQALRGGGLRSYEVTPDLLDARQGLGTGYELEIAVPESSMLDWDAPLVSQQSNLQRVWNAIRDQWSRENAAAVRNGLASPVPANAEDILTDMQRNPAYTGQSLWHTAVNAAGGRGGGEKFAADMLHEAGLPGVRYLDAGSRAAGEGTRNYVIFPGAEDQIRILRKFGILAPLAAGLGGDE